MHEQVLEVWNVNGQLHVVRKLRYDEQDPQIDSQDSYAQGTSADPTEYLMPQGLHDLIRNPRAVRAWPAMTMPPFPPDSLSDREIELVVAI